jgi:hypothetical protein
MIKKNKQKNNVEVVIAAFNEDLSWIKEIKHPIYLYYKSNNYKKIISNEIIQYLPNIGRESHTYIHHIVANYNRLADVTVFCQGNPFEHCPYFIESVNSDNIYQMNEYNRKIKRKIYSFDSGFCPLANWFWIKPAKVSPNDPLALIAIQEFLPQCQMLKNFLGLWGAMFAVTKEKIQSYPKKTYKKILELHKEHFLMPYAMENIWMHIFNENYKPFEKQTNE